MSTTTTETLRAALERYPLDGTWTVLGTEDGSAIDATTEELLAGEQLDLDEEAWDTGGALVEIGQPDRLLGGYRPLGMTLARWTGPTVRRFSPCGPCLTLGPLLRLTPRFAVYIDRNGDRLTERRVARDAVHLEACSSCRGGSSYPAGWQD